KRNVAIDTVEHAFLGLTVETILGMDPVVRQPHRHALERQLLAFGIEPQRHRRAGTEAREQQIVRAWPRIESADLDWFVGKESVRPTHDLLLEFAIAGFAHKNGADFDLF